MTDVFLRVLGGAMIAVVLACVAGLAWCSFMLARNRWVYAARMKMLSSDPSRYDRLPDYDEMMRRWWIWDVDRFLGPKNGLK